MEIKQHVTLEVKKGEHTFVFHMPFGCTWGQSLDAAFDMLQEVNKMAQQAVSQAKPSEPIALDEKGDA